MTAAILLLSGKSSFSLKDYLCCNISLTLGYLKVKVLSFIYRRYHCTTTSKAVHNFQLLSPGKELTLPWCEPSPCGDWNSWHCHTIPKHGGGRVPSSPPSLCWYHFYTSSEAMINPPRDRTPASSMEGGNDDHSVILVSTQNWLD